MESEAAAAANRSARRSPARSPPSERRAASSAARNTSPAPVASTCRSAWRAGQAHAPSEPARVRRRYRPPRRPAVTASACPGRARSRSSPSPWSVASSPGTGRSSRLIAMRSARCWTGPATGTRAPVGCPGTRCRRSPCQPRATVASGDGTSAHSGPSSPATGANRNAGAPRQAGGSAATGSGSDVSWHICHRPAGVSRFSNTGPCESSTVTTSTRAARSIAGSPASTEVRSRPTSAPTRSPRRASISEPYDTPPPGRHAPRPSASRSRVAAPTTTTSGISETAVT